MKERSDFTINYIDCYLLSAYHYLLLVYTKKDHTSLQRGVLQNIYIHHTDKPERHQYKVKSEIM
jgi:hypothetical protein